MKKSVNSLMVKAVILGILFAVMIALTIPVVSFCLKKTKQASVNFARDDYTSNCAMYADEGAYGDLYELLADYELYDADYDEYWELANGYLDYVNCVAYRKAWESGYEPAKELYEESYAKVLENAREYRFDRNFNALTGFAQMLTEGEEE